MLSLTRKADYALVAMAELAMRWREDGEPVSAKAVAEQHNLPQALLMNIMKSLAQANLLESRRGANGGYTLSRSPATISVMEVICAVDGPMQFTPCSGSLPVVGQGCCVSQTCPISEQVQQLHSRIYAFLETMTLEAMCGENLCTTAAGQP